jgi:hypothetical protein
MAASRSNSNERIDELAQQMSAVLVRLDAISQRLEEQTPSINHSSGSSPAPENPHRPRLKLDVPRFSGSDANGWIFKISQFFTYHQTPEEDRITIASFYLDGPVLTWYQWMYSNRQIVSWNQFLRALEIRFAPAAYDDPKGNLFKLTQSGSVNDYLAEFESLANRIVGLSPMDLLSCFISGLKIEIRREVLAQQPNTLSQAAGLARLQEDKLQDALKASRSRPFQAPYRPPLNSSPAKNLTAPGLLPTPATKPRFRHLSEHELAERREKGMCFNCDQKWSRQHRCGGRAFLLLADNEDGEVNQGQLESSIEIDPTDESPPAQLSLHALAGSQATDTFRVMGRIKQQPVNILVDGGSTHNFIRKLLFRPPYLLPRPPELTKMP